MAAGIKGEMARQFQLHAGERINGESMRDLVGVGFVHVTTSRLFVTEEGAAWLRSSGIEVSSYA